MTNRSFFSRSFCLGIFSCALSPSWALAPFWDDISLSFGLAKHDFRSYSIEQFNVPTRVAQHFESTAPCIQMSWDKEFAPAWHTKWTLAAQYDMGLDSENALNNGRRIVDAHAWMIDSKSLILFDTDPAQGVKIGAGLGSSIYAIMNIVGEAPTYTRTPLFGPILRAEKHYHFLGLEGMIASEVSRLDCTVQYLEQPFHYNWYRYSLENVFWIKRTPDVDQGLRVEFIYWSLDEMKLMNRQWVRDFHGISWCLEFKFK